MTKMTKNQKATVGRKLLAQLEAEAQHDGR